MEHDTRRLLLRFFGPGEGLLDRVRQATGGDGNFDPGDGVETSPV